jgi:hypothetical protein
MEVGALSDAHFRLIWSGRERKLNEKEFDEIATHSSLPARR